MATHSSTLAWKIPWTKEPSRLQSMGLRRSDTTEGLHFHFSISCTGEGNGDPLQCSCMENPRDSGAWWAAVHGVTKSRTWLSDFTSLHLQTSEFDLLCQHCDTHPPHVSSLWKKFPQLLTYSNHIPSSLSSDHTTDDAKFWYFGIFIWKR